MFLLNRSNFVRFGLSLLLACGFIFSGAGASENALPLPRIAPTNIGQAPISGHLPMSSVEAAVHLEPFSSSQASYLDTDWEWQMGKPASDLRGVWGASASDVFAVGDMGSILHYDGKAWKEMDNILGGAAVRAIWGSSSTDIFIAAGHPVQMYHYDGEVWQPQECDLSNSVDHIFDLWGSSPTDVFAVGRDNDIGSVVRHYDGVSWSTSYDGAGFANLNGVWGPSGSNVFVVGQVGTILHFDGMDWTEMTHNAGDVDFNDVWGSSDSNIFAVGDGGTIIHFNGTDWTQMAHSATTVELRSVWGSSGSDLYAVGDDGVVLHYDGSNWSAINSPTGVDLWAIWGNSGSDIFAVGNFGKIIHYNGQYWSPRDGEPRGLWGSSASNIFSVGDRGAIRHFDGTRWTDQESTTYANLKGVWGSAANAVFAVGNDGTIIHYDGFNWTPMTSGTTNDLQAVWGTSGSNVFAVGDLGKILHYDGANWSSMTNTLAERLYGVWGSSASDVFAVGSSGRILHYNGASWAPMTSGSTVWLKTVWGNSGSDVFAVGGAGTILRYDGNNWSKMDSTIDHDIYGVWGTSGSNVYAVAEYETILHYDGSDWTVVQDSIGGVYNISLMSIWGSSATDIWAAGIWDSLFHYDGIAWVSEAHYLYLFDIWGSSGTDVFTVGSWGNIFHYNGIKWDQMPRVTSARLRGVWGSSGSDVFSVGDGGVVLHYDGVKWTSMPSGTTSDLKGVWGSSGSAVFAVGGRQVGYDYLGTIHYYDGSAWSLMTTVAGNYLSYSLLGVWGSSPNDVYAVGEGGLITHFDGVSWTPVETLLDITDDLIAVWGTSASDVYVVGERSTVIHFDGTSWAELDPGRFGIDFHDIWGASGENIFMVGFRDVYDNATMVHYDGLNWYAVEREGSATYGVWGSSATDVFAVGAGNSILHFSGATCKFDISPRSATFPRTGGNSFFDVFAEPDSCVWNAVSHTLFVNLDSSCGVGNGAVPYTVDPMTYIGTRTGDVSLMDQMFRIHQGGSCTYDISPLEADYDNLGGSGSFTITPSFDGCGWQVESLAQWLSIDSGESGVGTGLISYTVAENPTTADRRGIILAGGLSHLVNQSKVPVPGITLSPISGLITSETGTQDSFSTVLNTQPESMVSIDFVSSDQFEGVITPWTLQFDASNWDIPQWITLTGIDDSMRDGDQPYSIVSDASVSSDVVYSGLNPDDISAVNLDDEAPCEGTDLILKPGDFPPGARLTCNASQSISFEEGIEISASAIIKLYAPLISIPVLFQVEQGSSLHMGY